MLIKKISKIIIFIYLFIFINIIPSLAFKVALPSETIELDKTNEATLIVSNESKHLIAIDVSVTKRNYNIDGTETYSEPTDKFLIIPPQFILDPKAEQVVTIRWISTQNVTQELAYRLIAANVPLPSESHYQPKSGEKSTKLSIVYRVINSLYIQPKNIFSNVVLDKIENVTTKNKKTVLNIILHNKGKKHQIIGSFEIKITGKNFQKIIKVKQKNLDDGNRINLLAGNKRRISIPWNIKYPKKHLQGSLLKISEK